MTHGHEHDGTVNKSRDEKSAYTARRTLHSFHDTGACQNTRPKARRGSIVFWSFPPRYFVTPVASKGVNATMIDEKKTGYLSVILMAFLTTGIWFAGGGSSSINSSGSLQKMEWQ